MGRKIQLAVVLVLVVAAALLILLPLPTKYKKDIPPNSDPWVLVSYNPVNEYGTYLGNGFIATRIMGDGVGSQGGNPLPCFAAGFYDEEKLIQIPNWSDLRFYDGKIEFKIDKEADYRQSLNMKTGILTTLATWRAGRKSLRGKINVIISRAQPNVALIYATLTPDFDGEVRAESSIAAISDRLERISSPLDDESVLHASYRTKQSGIVLSIAKSLDTYMSGRTAISSSRIARGVSVKRGRRFNVSSYSSLVTDLDLKTAQDTAYRELKSVLDQEASLISRHKAAWAKLWKKDIIIDGPKKDQQAIHSCMFYLLESVREGSQWSIPPMGLSDAAFSGHVFWDADIWMFPALILQHPELARSIVDYRYNTLKGAMANAKASGYTGAEYAWESGYSGKEDTPPGLPYVHERHINGDVALAQWQYYLATGDLNWLKERGYPVLKATADYWVSRVKYMPEKQRYEIHKVVPPDENADLVDNNAYTNIIAKMNLELAGRAAKLLKHPVNPKWSEVAEKIYIPFDFKKRRFIAFDNYEGNQAKQADSELVIYPLQYKITGNSMTDIYNNTFNFYSPKVMKYGPAMSSSAYTVIAARLGDKERAYKEFVRSYKPFLRGPFNYFNEKSSKIYTNMCFLTGAAGPVQSTIFGIAGAAMDYSGKEPSKLQYTPCLPEKWRSLKITGIAWRGELYDIEVSRNKELGITPSRN